MRFLDELSLWFYVPAWVISLVTVVLAARSAPWRGLLARSERQHLFFALTVFYAVFWQLNVEVRGELEIHLLGITTAVLVFGWQLAMGIGVLAVASSLLWGGHWLSLGVEVLFTVVLPVVTVQCVFLGISALRNINLFFYILGIGFFGAMLSVLNTALIAGGYIALWGSDTLKTTFQQYYYILLLMMFPEGFINGATIATLAVFRPDLLRTLDERRLIDDQ